MNTRHGRNALDQPWRLPSSYEEMAPNEQQSVMQACILKFLEEKGRARAKDVLIGIGASRGQEATVRRNLQKLATTQHIYVDPIGRDPIYYRNGSLAHPSVQDIHRAGTREYVIRTYSDDLAGRTLTITEYAVTPIGRSRPIGGIRIDVADFGALVEKLARIQKRIEEDPGVLDGTLLR